MDISHIANMLNTLTSYETVIKIKRVIRNDGYPTFIHNLTPNSNPKKQSDNGLQSKIM